MLKMEDEAGGDGKLLAVPIDKILSIYTPLAEARGPEPAAPEDDPALLRALQGPGARQVGQGRGWEGPDAARAGNHATASPATPPKSGAAPGRVEPSGSASRRRRRLERAALVRARPGSARCPAPSRARKSSTASRELRVRQPVRRAGLHRQQAARHLVLALRAAFEARVAVGDAPRERLVVAGLEVQAGHVLDRAPVAAEGGLALAGRSRSASWRCACRRARR